MSKLPYRTLDEVVEILAGYRPARQHREPRPVSVTRRMAIVADRKTIRSAFDIVRRDPSEQNLRKRLVDALAGRAQITDTLLDTARTIIADAALRAIDGGRG